MWNGFIRPSLQMLLLTFLANIIYRTDTASAIRYPAHPLQIPNKFNSAGEQGPELPPLVFPSFSDEGKVPNRRGEEVPPLVFPKGPDDDSHEVHDATHLSKLATNQVIVSGTKEEPAKESASEVQDLLHRDPYVTVYDDDAEGVVQDTVTVTGPNVINNGKTHEEDVTAPSVQTRENDTTSNLVTSFPPTSDPNETTFDYLNVSTGIGNNVSSTEDFIHSGNATELTGNVENFTDAVGTHNDVPMTTADITVKDDERRQSVSEKNITPEEEVSPAVRSTEDEPATTESHIRIKGETTVVSESLASTTQGSFPGKLTSTLLVQQASVTTLKPKLHVESTTFIDISENLIDHKAEDIPVAMAASQKHTDDPHASSGESSTFLQPTESAAILAAVFVGVALIGYIGLLLWRRVLEKRYGNREMLVNEDDFYDTNDLKNFEL